MTETERLALLYRDIFEIDARGQAILEDLHRRFGTPKCVATGGLDAVLQTYKSSAQAAVIGHIFSMINRANGAPDLNPPEGEFDE